MKFCCSIFKDRCADNPCCQRLFYYTLLFRICQAFFQKFFNFFWTFFMLFFVSPHRQARPLAVRLPQYSKLQSNCQYLLQNFFRFFLIFLHICALQWNYTPFFEVYTLFKHFHKYKCYYMIIYNINEAFHFRAKNKLKKRGCFVKNSDK